MALSDADAARLVSLQAAYDKLISGAAVAAVSTLGGRHVQYTKADISRLEGEIAKLVAAQAAPTSCPPRTRGALRFVVR